MLPWHHRMSESFSYRLVRHAVVPRQNVVSVVSSLLRVSSD